MILRGKISIELTFSFTASDDITTAFHGSPVCVRALNLKIKLGFPTPNKLNAPGEWLAAFGENRRICQYCMPFNKNTPMPLWIKFSGIYASFACHFEAKIMTIVPSLLGPT